jgi:hypothetical protein
LIVFGIGDLNRVKAAALHQVKCGIFNSSFLPKDDSIIKQLATDCLTAQVHHNGKSIWAVVGRTSLIEYHHTVELSAWAAEDGGTLSAPLYHDAPRYLIAADCVQWPKRVLMPVTLQADTSHSTGRTWGVYLSNYVVGTGMLRFIRFSGWTGPSDTLNSM